MHRAQNDSIGHLQPAPKIPLLHGLTAVVHPVEATAHAPPPSAATTAAAAPPSPIPSRLCASFSLSLLTVAAAVVSFRLQVRVSLEQIKALLHAQVPTIHYVVCACTMLCVRALCCVCVCMCVRVYAASCMLRHVCYVCAMCVTAQVPKPHYNTHYAMTQTYT